MPTGGVLSAPATLAFPATATGKPGTIKTLMIRNLSRTSPLWLEVGSLAAPFAVSGSTHYAIAAGASVPIAILFSPTNCGTSRQVLQINSSDPNHPIASVVVTAMVLGGKLSIPSKVAFTAPMTAVATRTVVLKNSGAGTLSGSAQAFGANSPFTILCGPVLFSLAPGQSQVVTVQFKPARIGTVEGNLVIAMVNPIGTASISVSGSGK